MKRAFVVLAALAGVLAIIIWVASWFRAPEAAATSAARPWPGGMGSLDAVDDRLPPQKANDAALKLWNLGGALQGSEAVDEFVRREMSRAETMIGEPPALPDVAGIRELLLSGPVVWERHVAFDDTDATKRRGMQMTMAKALLANALTKAREGDAAAWDDLRAVWNLARSLEGHPQMLAQTAALTMARWINAVAWKMPLPAPAWLGEMQARDQMQPLLEAYQYQTASYWKSGMQMFPTKSLASSVEHDRQIAEEVFKTTACDVKMRENRLGVDLRSVWRRAFRYRVEREATANALRIREGKPIESASRCSDGAWAFDGTTLRFSREIPTAAPDRPMPLVLRVEPEPADAPAKTDTHGKMTTLLRPHRWRQVAAPA